MIQRRSRLPRSASLLLAGSALAVGLLLPIPAAATSIGLNPATVSVGVGATTTLSIEIEDVSDLYAFQFDLTFDPDVVSVTDILEGSFLSGDGTTFYIPGTIDNALGTVTFTANTLIAPIPGVSGSGLLATLQLTGDAAGTSPIHLTNVVLLDSSLADILDFDTADGQVVVASGATTVPEPATLAMVAAGAIFVYGRRAWTRRSVRG